MGKKCGFAYHTSLTHEQCGHSPREIICDMDFLVRDRDKEIIMKIFFLSVTFSLCITASYVYLTAIIMSGAAL